MLKLAAVARQPFEASATPKPEPPAPVAFHYQQSDSFVALLLELRASLLVSTYQANKLLAVRATGTGLSTLVRSWDKPMGLAVDPRRLAIGTRKEVWFLKNAPDIAPRIEPAGQHDACFLPRASHVTGDIGVHEIAWAGEQLWMVNTRFSCLCTLSPDYSFVPRWRPPFITDLAAEDRCHLNGLAMAPNERGALVPRYVTALGTTDTRGGWRVDKPSGGCVIDVASGELVARGLSMPHSPRWHEGRLWLLESGTGRFGFVDLASGRFERISELPGFARGLVLVGHHAIIGLSKIRSSSAMDGVPLAERREQLQCGVVVVDVRTGQTVAFLKLESAIEEIFDVQILRHVKFPEILGFQQDTIHHTFVVPAHFNNESTLSHPAVSHESNKCDRH